MISPNFPFIPAGGETGSLIKSIDWEKHPLGPPALWPNPLKITLGIMHGSKHAMFLFWGPELYCFYNDGYLPSFGVGKHPAAMGQRGEECWPEIWPVIYPQIRDVMDEGKASWHVDQYLPIYRNGKLEDVYWTYSYSPVHDVDGSVCAVMVVGTETTKDVQMRRELAQARQELNAFLMQAPIGIVFLSGPEHVFTFINPKYMQMLFPLRPMTELLHKPVREALPEIKGQGFYEILDGVYQTGKPFVGTKLKISIGQGNGENKEMYVNFTYEPKYDSEGKIDGILVVVYEVTDQVNEQKEIEQLAENLRSAVLARDTFLGIASHELNTPLTSLKLQVEMDKRLLDQKGIQPFGPEKIKKMLDSTLFQTNRLGALVKDMLDVSQINSGKLVKRVERTNFSNLVLDTFDRFLPQLDAVNCTLETHITPEIHLNMDASRMEQVITNLITNVIKYAPGKGVEVTLSQEGPRVIFSLKDGGEGIEHIHLNRIFGRFERAASHRDSSGLGLGLYLTRQIINEHGGEIYVESEKGKGSRFYFELPSNF